MRRKRIGWILWGSAGRMPLRLWTKGFRQYLLLQLPDIVVAGVVLSVLHRWAGLPVWAAIVLFFLWVVKDIAPYPWYRDIFERRATTGPESLIGAKGIAVEDLNPVGYVRLNGELWRAEAKGGQLLPAGTEVVVHELRGLTLGVMDAR